MDKKIPENYTSQKSFNLVNSNKNKKLNVILKK